MSTERGECGLVELWTGVTISQHNKCPHGATQVQLNFHGVRRASLARARLVSASQAAEQ